ncbi:hypothetical protein [Flavobacterium sp. TAB 87]|uniref:hypothetical protein n=1 Tax=Flavobacterium sp. TAB 87 TaxID=1729581 RepID=UPI00076CF76B|nr:hypothetical protein [Flavobacterium sp. TAB 87]KVV16149.1 hypothetical protein AP058_00314 [Flavobacterium sp. TAB 87]
MATKNTVKNWFLTGLKPTQAQFHAFFDSIFWKGEKIPVADIEGIENILNAKAEAAVLDAHLIDSGAHADLFGDFVTVDDLDNYTLKGGSDLTAKGLSDKIDDVYQPNVLISSVQPTRAANKFTYPALSYDVLINKVRYKNSLKFETTILAAAENFKRTDLVYITIDGVMGIKVGAENTTVSVRPELTANEVAVSFINVFGNDVEAPVAVDNKVSIQNSIGQHQFYMEDFLRVRGVDFDDSTKQIIISPLSPNTAFVDNLNGNDATAEIENSKKPFKTIDGVFARYTADQSVTAFVRLYLVNASVYPWNNKIYNISFEIYSDKAATVDMSGASSGSIFINFNVSLRYTMYLNIPLGTLRNNKLTTGCSFSNEDFSTVVNLKSINWTCDSTVFGTLEGVIFLTLSELTLVGNLMVYSGIVKTPLSLAKLSIVGKINNPLGIIVKELTIPSGDAPFANGEEWTIGNIFGKLNFSYTHNSTIKIKFNDSIITEGINFAGNDQGNIVFSGNIKSTIITGSILANRADRIGTMTWTDLTIQDLKSNGIFFHGGYITLKVINCYINQTVGTWLFRNTGKTLGNCSYRVEKTTLRQATPGVLLSLDNNNLITTIDIGGFESNCLSITDVKNSPITFDLLSFKDKKREIVIRSKIDLVDRVLDSEMNYMIDGVINLLPTERIIVPVGGLSISGYGFDVSAIRATQPNSIIYQSPTGGCGNLFIQNLSHEASGGGSKVFDLTNAGAPTGGADAIELGVVNFDNCDSLGILKNFRQGLWDNIGAFGCKDGLTLEGVWSGGFRADLVIVRNFGVASVGGTLFKKGAGLLFKSRFLTDINADFKTSGSLSDFDSSTFNTTKLYQVKAAQVTRNNVLDDTQNYTGTLNAFSPECDWSGNNGMKNSNIHPYGISTDKMNAYSNDAAAASGGIAVGQVYVETVTGYFKTRLA